MRDSCGSRCLPRAAAGLFGLCLLGRSLQLCGAESNPTAPPHSSGFRRPVLAAEDGPLLGNGDLSVSVYQAADRIVWRFGKSDAWDRRLDLSDDPKPAQISKIAHG